MASESFCVAISGGSHAWRHPGTLHHFAFYVADFEAAARQMSGRGWVAVQTGDGFGRTRDGRFAYYEHGDDIGCLVEIVQAPTERDAPELIYPTGTPARGQG